MDAEIPVISPGDPIPDADEAYRIVLVDRKIKVDMEKLKGLVVKYRTTS